MIGDEQLSWLLCSLHYAYPVISFLYFAVASSISICTLQTTATDATTVHARRTAIVWLYAAFVLCFLAQLLTKLATIASHDVWPTQDTIIGLLSCILVFGIQQNSLSSTASPVWYPYYGPWLIAIAMEPAVFVTEILAHNKDTARSDWYTVSLAIAVLRFVILLAMVLAFLFLGGYANEMATDEERTLLLPKPDHSSDGDCSADSGYGTNTETTNTEANNTETVNSPSDPESPWERQERIAREQMEKRLKSEGSWFAYIKGFMVFFPYVWPVNNRRLQANAVLVGVCLLAGNALNFLIPRQLGAVMDSLSGFSGQNPWVQVMIFAGLRLLASEAGLSLVRQFFWLPVEYYSQEAISTAAYSHVMNLSSEFHDSKSSSDLIVAISHGTSISNMLESLCFRAIPMMIDLVVAFSYLSSKFGAYEGFITVATGLAFIQAAARMIAGFQNRRKKMVKAYFEEHYVRQAGIQGWHTVSAFNQVPYEEERYGVAVSNSVTAIKSIYVGYLLRQALQYLILLAGLLAGAFLAVYQITNGQATPGDFFMLLTYWSQLTGPLQFFSSLGRSISQDLVHAERLLEVMLTKPTVMDRPDAKPLKLNGGQVELRDVSFSYDKKKDILKSVNMCVPSGTTAAFVGATGAGKSTILKVLDRFYDVSGGSILIDGQDIRDVTLSSLRQSIGIVPQAPILFDDTVINNIRYARLTATDEEIYAACKAAAIHEQIMGFTDGYQTRVGERGVKLSGGELQRIAIARAILKRPDIVLLDEATSSVDTDTEQKIQDGLQILCEGRTTFIVAHRLSTVMNADVIFVVADGEIVEHGNHEDLIAKDGKYAELWSKQIFVKPKEAKVESDNKKKTGDDANEQVTKTPKGHRREVESSNNR
ncbi:uncharacterized protein B0I36DRAFT_235306 [Microdochium trichocladiopsis]|uniref:Heavy metal tolerance protein n=1 Tax=Microdochium trichocladiopsis TaxID=1682393 RepID=A0A9P8YG50_9PEZI|nr:uncharacterized protein B0I36DRAFT_235306 [Microdochium trichocladiopsis]KAH7039769.1 hypothetical protein B0I36DRAFT_235306 [Microdochium trichocladiopsis]